KGAACSKATRAHWVRRRCSKRTSASRRTPDAFVGDTTVNALQYFFDALSVGSLYALAALGIALIFGVMRLINFAHGDVITFSVFVLIAPTTEAAAPLLVGSWSTPLLVATVLAAGALVAVACELLVFRHLRRATPAATMITSFALGFVIQNTLLAL